MAKCLNCVGLVKRGYTLFSFVRGNEPKYSVTEIREDLYWAVRFVRNNVIDFGIKLDAD